MKSIRIIVVAFQVSQLAGPVLAHAATPVFRAPELPHQLQANAAQETDDTAALVADAANPKRLSYFQFNDPNWLGDAGQKPLLALNASQTASFDGAALQMNTNVPSVLKYREKEPNGSLNINARSGSLRFCFKPFWTSQSQRGKGPGEWVRLFEWGNPDASGGGMALSIDPEGNNILFTTKDAAGRTFSASGVISVWSNSWSTFTLTFGTVPACPANRVSLFLFGSEVIRKQNPDALPLPPAAVRANGFTLGSSSDGTHQVKGLIDEWEVFNYELGKAGASILGYAISAKINNDPLRIALRWQRGIGATWMLQRRLFGTANWLTLTKEPEWHYNDFDPALQNGQAYEYRLTYTESGPGPAPFKVGVNLPPRENRGRVILLVDNQLASGLARELDQLQADLVGDGWQVIRHDAPRHQDEAWAANTNNIAQIKSWIIRDWNTYSNDLKCIFIVGHVAVPYSGFSATDGHVAGVAPPDHQGAWPADVYYGDVNGKWTDSQPAYTNRDFPEQTNLPGDGKFDQEAVPPNDAGLARLEMAVGRVDFARLPLFQTPPSGNAPQTELGLMKRYLAKDHRFRIKSIVVPFRAMAGSFGGDQNVIYEDALNNACRMFGFDSGQILDGNPFTTKWACLWAFASGWGNSISIVGSEPLCSTPALTDVKNEPPMMFYDLNGSWFGDWNMPNNLLRALLATPNYGLAALWRRPVVWRFEGMALGDTLGDGYLHSINDPQLIVGVRKRELSILGDPTLRFNYTAPPGAVKVTRKSSRATVLAWTASADAPVRYFVYRASGNNGTFQRLTPQPLSALTFSDGAPPAGRKTYLVKAVQLINSGGGSFTNLSQAALVNVE